MTRVGIVNKCKLTPCLLQVFQGRYGSSGSTNTVQFHFWNMNIAKRKPTCLVMLVVLLSRAGKQEIKCVICPLLVFRLGLCFEKCRSALCQVLCSQIVSFTEWPLFFTRFTPVFHPFQCLCPLLPTRGAALALG